MLLKKLLCVAAAVVSAGTFMISAVSAESSEEKVIIPFEADDSLLFTNDSIPAVSFDTSDWEKYVHITPDGEAMGIKMKQDTTTFYQGASLKVYSDSEGVKDKYYNYAESVRDADGNLLYPEASNEDTEFFTPGIELRAEDFGLSCFDGCLITFTYRMGVDTENKLLENSVYAFPVDSEYSHLLNIPSKLTYNVLENDNVSQYRKLMIPVPAEVGATRIVFETPITQKISSDIFYIDNIGIGTPLKEGDVDLYVKNLDGYNSNAKPQEIINSVKIKEKGNDVSLDESAGDKEKDSGFSPVVIVIVVLAAAVIGVVIVVVIKHKNKFY